MPRLKISLTFDGTNYRGWQIQKNARHTLQGVLEEKLAIIANTRVPTFPCGRTDAGVHARVMVVQADVPESTLRLLGAGSPIPGESRLKQGLNRLLPRDLRVLAVEEAPPGFHALRDVHRKTYLYFIDTSPVQLPELRRYSWHLRLPMDWKAIEQATPAFAGRHDFKAFCGKGSKVKTTVRTLHEVWWGTHLWQGIAHPVELKVLRVTGSGFLKQMVRSIVGTLVHIGNGKASPEIVGQLLQTGHRPLVGPTAPAHGLWLWDVSYRKR